MSPLQGRINGGGDPFTQRLSLRREWGLALPSVAIRAMAPLIRHRKTFSLSSEGLLRPSWGFCPPITGEPKGGKPHSVAALKSPVAVRGFDSYKSSSNRKGIMPTYMMPSSSTQGFALPSVMTILRKKSPEFLREKSTAKSVADSTVFAVQRYAFFFNRQIFLGFFSVLPSNFYSIVISKR